MRFFSLACVHFPFFLAVEERAVRAVFVWSACRRLFYALASISGLDGDCVLLVEENVRTAAVIMSGWCGATSTFLVRHVGGFASRDMFMRLGSGKDGGDARIRSKALSVYERGFSAEVGWRLAVRGYMDRKICVHIRSR